MPHPLNNSAIDPPHLSLVRHQSSSSSQNTPRYIWLFDSNDSNSNINELSSPVIPVSPPLIYSFINLPQLSSVFQHSYRSSHNTTNDLQTSSIPGWTSPDPSNIMPLPSTNNVSRNIYGCMLVCIALLYIALK